MSLPKPMAAFVWIEIIVKTTLLNDDEMIHTEIKSKSKKLVGLSRLSDASRNILNKRKLALSINVAMTAYGLKPSNRNFTLSILRSADVADTAAVVAVLGSTTCKRVLQHLYLLSFTCNDDMDVNVLVRAEPEKAVTWTPSKMKDIHIHVCIMNPFMLTEMNVSSMTEVWNSVEKRNKRSTNDKNH